MPKDTLRDIFGYPWARIQSAQQGGRLHDRLDLTSRRLRL